MNTQGWKLSALFANSSLAKNLMRLASKRRLLLLAALVAVALGGCAGNRQPINTTERNNACKPWRAISYDSRGDTPNTVRQVQEHNETGANIGCWPR